MEEMDLDDLEKRYTSSDTPDEPPSTTPGASEKAENGPQQSSSSSGGSGVNVIGKPVSKNSVLVNPRQRGNPVLKYIRNVPWEYSEIIPDYIMGGTTCGLFLSIRYHNLHPDYIHERLKELRSSFQLRVLLVHVDVADPYPILKTLTHIAMLADLCLLPVHSSEECGRIIENYKIYENKPPDIIQEKQDSSILQQVIDALTSIRSVNKTDALTLLTNFGSLAGILKATPTQIATCPGFGPQKAGRLHTALHQSFKRSEDN